MGKIKFNDVKQTLDTHGYKLLIKENEYKGVTLTDLYCIDDDGYKYKVVYDYVIRRGKHNAVDKSNPFAIENINHFLDIYANSEYQCLNCKYINKSSILTILHKKCGRTFETCWSNINRKPSIKEPNRHGSRCPFCEASQLESTHAIVLKQVWKYERSGTIVEDKSCINYKTGHSLPTDIVNHNDKVAIEIQSWFHDFDDQKIKDNIKRLYWESVGYDFYAVDQRDYTVLQMIQIFFPHIKQIPDYIDFEYANKLNDIQIQNLLNKGYKVVEISKMMNTNSHKIYDAIRYGRIEYPQDYIADSYTQVVQLSLDGDFIKSYNSIIGAATECKLSSRNISSCMLSGKNYSSGYLWFYKHEYENLNYTIPNTRYKKSNSD